jgi:hypothetical protein
MRTLVGAQKVLVAIVAVVSALMLSACAGPRSPVVPEPPTVAEINARIPEVVAGILGADRASTAGGIFVECRNAVGDTTTEASLGGLDFRPLVIADDATRRERIEACRIIAPAAGVTAYLFSEAQLDYLHDYVETFLRPCLASLGVFTPRTPTRTEFATEFGTVWSPYDELGAGGAASTSDLEDACPRFPSALAFDAAR